jgi:hypothetical protein
MHVDEPHRVRDRRDVQMGALQCASGLQRLLDTHVGVAIQRDIQLVVNGGDRRTGAAGGAIHLVPVRAEAALLVDATNDSNPSYAAHQE